MMRIILNQKFKSLTNIPLSIDVPDFTVISGVNGAGKSHLLQAIHQNVAIVIDENGNHITPVKYTTVHTLVPNDAYSIGSDQLTYAINNMANSLQYFHQQINEPHIQRPNYEKSYGSEMWKILNKICSNAGKTPIELTPDDVGEHYPIYLGLVSDIFLQNFSSLFKRYADRYEDNLFKNYLKDVKGKKVRVLSEEKFREKYGPPPWEIANEIFESANIDYTINDPLDLDRNLPFTFKLINKTNGANVNFNDLSSGEKVLMSLTLALYNRLVLLLIINIL